MTKNSMIEEFLKYVAINTKSDPTSSTCPSSEIQFNLAHLLVEELQALGLAASVDANGYVYSRIPANTTKECPTVCFLAHMDTAPDISGENVKPQIIENYDGGVITLNQEYSLEPNTFPELKNYINKTLITTSGDTLLGADDKAGIAEIMQAIKYILSDDTINHGDISICFTPDEEIGRGVDKIDLAAVDADFAYTIDGGGEGILAIENFNAAGATIEIKGLNVHPGEAYNKMINAATIARNIDLELGDQQRPEHTRGYEGFYLLTALNAQVDFATMNYIIRDHDRDIFESRKQKLTAVVEKYAQLNPQAEIKLTMNDNYYNMIEKVREHMDIVTYAQKAYENQGLTMELEPIRGGTDGARLSFMGLPCPNIFTGGHNYHGRFEYVCVDSMLKASHVIVDIVKEVEKNA